MSSRKRKQPPPSVTTPPLDTPVINGFDVLFAGLICFAKIPRVALFANGVAPKMSDVVPHNPYLIVNPSYVTKEVGWQNVDPIYKRAGIYQLPKCRVEISRATTTTTGKLDASQHDQYTPLLRDVDPTIDIDPSTANAIVRVNLANGTLQALRHPNPNPHQPDNVAIISRLRVENDSNPITIDIVEGTATITRSLELKANTDIVLVNIGLPPDSTKLGNHFSIYGALTKNGTIKGFPLSSPNVTVIHRKYYVFTLTLPIVDGEAMCGTSGCCPPPP